jgi:hypothetical protein
MRAGDRRAGPSRASGVALAIFREWWLTPA